MANCYMCDTQLLGKNDPSTNRSEEHIILNALGGKLKSDSLLCKNCNSKFGNEADGVLAKQLSQISSFLQIERDRGAIQVIKDGKDGAGNRYNIKDGYKPMLAYPIIKEIEVKDGHFQVSVTASEDKHMKQALKGLAKKYPGFNVEEAMKQMQRREAYLEEPITYNIIIGGETAFKSIVKTVFGFYLLRNPNKQHLFPEIISYLRNEKLLSIAKLYIPTKVPYKKEAGEVIHLIHVVGIKPKQLLYAYVEYFSTFSFLVLLSDKYEGRNFKQTYAYNLIEGAEVSKKVQLKFTLETILNILEQGNTKQQRAAVVDKLNRLFKIIDKRHTSIAIDILIKRVTDRVLGKYPEGSILTKEILDELTNALSEEYIKFAFRTVDKKEK